MLTLQIDNRVVKACRSLCRNQVCVDVSLFSRYRGLLKKKMEAKLIPILGEETAAILEAHPEVDADEVENMLPNVVEGLVRMAISWGPSLLAGRL